VHFIEPDKAAAESAQTMMEYLWPHKAEDAHLQDTPKRLVSMFKELTTPCEIKWKTFPSEGDEMIVVRNIDFVSLCAHHMLPFIGKAHIGYIPNGHIAGLSKFARVVKHFAADLQVQERLTKQVALFLEHKLQAQGVAVVIEAEHMCMSIRGIQSPGTITTTSCMQGVFEDHSRLAREEFLHLISKGSIKNH
jgi:GTP cyclohydrolase IA